jgi:hypothetical protein
MIIGRAKARAIVGIRLLRFVSLTPLWLVVGGLLVACESWGAP